MIRSLFIVISILFFSFQASISFASKAINHESVIKLYTENKNLFEKPEQTIIQNYQILFSHNFKDQKLNNFMTIETFKREARDNPKHTYELYQISSRKLLELGEENYRSNIKELDKILFDQILRIKRDVEKNILLQQNAAKQTITVNESYNESYDQLENDEPVVEIEPVQKEKEKEKEKKLSYSDLKSDSFIGDNGEVAYIGFGIARGREDIPLLNGIHRFDTDQKNIFMKMYNQDGSYTNFNYGTANAYSKGLNIDFDYFQSVYGLWSEQNGLLLRGGLGSLFTFNGNMYGHFQGISNINLTIDDDHEFYLTVGATQYLRSGLFLNWDAELDFIDDLDVSNDVSLIINPYKDFNLEVGLSHFYDFEEENYYNLDVFINTGLRF